MSETKQTGGTASRRDFLKTSALAAAGATLTGLLPGGVHAAGDDQIKVGLIGCGGRGSGAAHDVLRAAKGVELVAIGDVFKFRVDGARRSLQDLQNDDTVRNLGNKVDLPEDRCFVGLDAYDKVINS